MRLLCIKMIDNAQTKSYDYLKIAIMDELLCEDELERFIPKLVADHIYYDGYLNNVACDVAPGLDLDVMPFPSTYEGQMNLLKQGIQLSGVKDPHEWFTSFAEDMYNQGCLNPFITADDVIK